MSTRQHTHSGRLQLPATVQTDARLLLSQQFWLWGYDVRRSEGNLLLDAGFQKQRPPEGSNIQNSRYALHLSATTTLTLWGFGAFLTKRDVGGVFLPRHALQPLYTRCCSCPDCAWTPEDIPTMDHPHTPGDAITMYRLLNEALSWLVDYERWVEVSCGQAYRQEAIAAWKEPACEADNLVSRWQSVQRRVAEFSRTIRPSRRQHASILTWNGTSPTSSRT